MRFLRLSGTDDGSMEPLDDTRLVAAVQSYFAALRDRDEQRWLALFCDDGVCHDPVGAVPAEGREGLREVWRILTAPFERLNIVAARTFYCGAGAAVHWSARGTGVNNREADFDGITVFEFAEDGRIQTVMSYWDPAAVLIELAGETPANG